MFNLSENEKEYLSSNKFILGIDVGITGGIGVLDLDGTYLCAYEMPVMAKGKGASTVKSQINASALFEILADYQGSRVVVESLSARPGQGVSSMFSLGDSFGVVRAICASLMMSAVFVAPTRWKKYLNLPSDKEVARAKAIELYPQARIHRKKDHGVAEAILLARYGYETL